MIKTPLPNNGNVAAEYLHENGLLKDMMTYDQIEEIIKPLMTNTKILQLDTFWEDLAYRAEELGYELYC